MDFRKTSFPLECLTALQMLLFAPLVTTMAQAPSHIDSTQHISEVTVYAHSANDMTPAQHLRGQRLQSLSSFSVADAIRYFSGVQIKDYGGVGGLKTIDIRSMGTNHMGIFYDGIQLGNAQNGQIDLGKFSMDNIGEISLYNGQKSDIFQPAKDFASAGTVYIRTRRPTFTTGKQYNIRLTEKFGSFGLSDPSLVWEQRWSNTLSSSFSAERIDASGKYKFRYRRKFQDGTVAWDTTAVRHNGDIRSWRIEGSLFGEIKDGIWNAKAYLYDSERGIPGAIVNNVWKRSQRQWDRNFFVQGHLQQRIDSQHEYQVNAKYANDFMRYLNPDTTLMYINNSFRQQEWYLSASHHASFTNNWEANLSVDYQHNTLSSNLTNFACPWRHSLLAAFATSYQWHKLKVMGSLLGTHIFEKQQHALNKYTPALFFSYRHDNVLSFRAFYKRVFRMPTFNDLYYTEVGNISLKPEWTTQYNMGILYSKDMPNSWLTKIELKADAYHNDVNDKIISVPKGNGQYRWMMMNIGKVRINGVEASAQAVTRFGETESRTGLPCWMLNVLASYTYQKAQDHTNPTDNEPVSGTYKGQIAYTPWHSGSFTANLTWRTLGINYAFIYVGKRYHNSANIAANLEQPWYTHDLSATWDWNAKPLSGSLAIECNNLLDQQYDVVLNYPMPGRNWRATIKVRI